MPNRLAKEKSPYLLQHKDNPVDWYPWGDEAFEKAKAENKPVFLSIGYATCHWCHVMEHESFEDETIAELMNDAFINVKVDREERPDVDSTYMTVCQMLNGHGGWPLTIVMNHKKEPFFAATYIPKEARLGRIGLRQLIPGIKGMWTHEPGRVEKAIEQIKGGFLKSQSFKTGELPGTEAIDYAAEQLVSQFDPDFGGFGTAPKFPSPHNMMFLLRQWKHTGDGRFLDAVSESLIAMRMGGIWDHVGFGFHRYSTDRTWLLPHFEKMLYDQALLMMVYTEAWQITQNPLFRQTVYEIAEYVFRDLMGKEPAFFSAEDADSEGEEGRFYVWNTSEIETFLAKEEVDFFKEKFNLKAGGNFADEATKELTGQNIPHLKKELSEQEAQQWNEICKKLFSQRSKRIRPLLDDKILTDWNALMITALAKAGAAFEDQEFIQKAEQAFRFLKEKLLANGKLLHRYKDGEAAITAFADDYAFMIWAGIELYEATFNAEYLETALELNKSFIADFWDEEPGAFFFTAQDTDPILGRQKQIFDGAVPSANSVALLNLIRLSRFTGDPSFEEKADIMGRFFSTDLIRLGSSITMSMMGLQFLNHDPTEIVIAEGDDNPGAFIAKIRQSFLPAKILIFRPRNEKDPVFDLCKFVKAQPPLNNLSCVYICRNYSCEKPVSDMDQLKAVWDYKTT